jgi:hypothetical protein
VVRLLPALFLIGHLCGGGFCRSLCLAQAAPSSRGAAPDSQAPADASAAFSKERDLLAKIHKNRIDVNAVYHVRELPLVREDVRFYFTDGILALLEPVEGRVTGAIFVGEGETLVMPPDPSEKRHLARYTGAPVLNEKFNAGFLRFGDDTAAKLTAEIAGHTVKAPFDKEEFLEQWSPVVQNLDLVYDLRLLDDLLVAAQPRSADSAIDAQRGFFLAHLFGLRLGAFDITIDPLAPEQVAVGQINWTEGRRYNDAWLSFPSASVRQKQKAKNPNASPLDGGAVPERIEVRAYKIDSTIGADRQMDVTATLDFDAVQSGERLLAFHISRFLKVSAVEMGGVKLLAYQNEGLSPEDALHGNDQVTVMLPAPLERGRHYSMTFHYAGSVIADAGHGVLYVGARGIWYPQRGYRIANYDLTFRIPRKLSLAATGELVSESEEGEWRISHWKSKIPIRVAGFNIGAYSESSAKSASGITVTVYANHGLEPALDSNRASTESNVTTQSSLHRRDLPSPAPLLPPSPDPAQVAAQMARDLAPVVDYFSKTFGPLPIDTLRVSPIPGKFGQGWPGLIYLSTLSYLLPYDPAARSSERLDVYFRSLLPVHEIAHQWWGHVVIPATYRDEWISEALASYSALLWLEQKDKSGPHKVREVMDLYRKELLEKHNDETAEAAGPLALGYRLDNSRTPNGTEHIYYDKGPWVIHMLRQLMRDPKTGSDAAFFQFLRALKEEFTGKSLTTAAFRQLAEKYVSPALNAEAGNQGRTLEWFFEQWVYGSGIPELKVEARMETRAAASAARAASARNGAKRPAVPGAGKIAGSATLQGVEESWVVPAPIYVQTAHGEVFAGVALAVVPGGADDPQFSLPLPVGAQKVLVDPGQGVLAIWK